MREKVKLPNPSVNVVVLAAAQGAADQFKQYPHCLTEVNGVPLLQKVSENVRQIENAFVRYVFLEHNISKFRLGNIARLLTPDADVFGVPEETGGSACTALLATASLDQDLELLIVSANEIIETSLQEPVDYFRENNLDAGTLIFKSIHPRYSYVELDNEDLVIEVSQKNPISENATAGVFWYKRTKDFVESAKRQIINNAHTDQKYYVAPVFNELILDNRRISVFRLRECAYVPFKEF